MAKLTVQESQIQKSGSIFPNHGSHAAINCQTEQKDEVEASESPFKGKRTPKGKTGGRYAKKRSSKSQNSQKSVDTGDAQSSKIGFAHSMIGGMTNKCGSQEDPGSPTSRPKTTENADKPRKLPSVQDFAASSKRSLGVQKEEAGQ